MVLHVVLSSVIPMAVSFLVLFLSYYSFPLLSSSDPYETRFKSKHKKSVLPLFYVQIRTACCCSGELNPFTFAVKGFIVYTLSCSHISSASLTQVLFLDPVCFCLHCPRWAVCIDFRPAHCCAKWNISCPHRRLSLFRPTRSLSNEHETDWRKISCIIVQIQGRQATWFEQTWM